MLQILVLLALATGLVLMPQANITNSWQGIVPLRSTRADVERLLGAATDSHGQTRIYKTQSERIDVSYSSGRCGPGQVWNAQPDIVVRLIVRPVHPTMIQDLDTKSYVRVKESHPANWVQYWSPDGGIVIQTTIIDQAEEVLSITYQATKSEKTPKCPAPRRRASLLTPSEPTIRIRVA